MDAAYAWGDSGNPSWVEYVLALVRSSHDDERGIGGSWVSQGEEREGGKIFGARTDVVRVHVPVAEVAETWVCFACPVNRWLGCSARNLVVMSASVLGGEFDGGADPWLSISVYPDEDAACFIRVERFAAANMVAAADSETSRVGEGVFFTTTRLARSAERSR